MVIKTRRRNKKIKARKLKKFKVPNIRLVRKYGKEVKL